MKQNSTIIPSSKRTAVFVHRGLGIIQYFTVLHPIFCDVFFTAKLSKFYTLFFTAQRVNDRFRKVAKRILVFRFSSEFQIPSTSSPSPLDIPTITAYALDRMSLAFFENRCVACSERECQAIYDADIRHFLLSIKYLINIFIKHLILLY